MTAVAQVPPAASRATSGWFERGLRMMAGATAVGLLLGFVVGGVGGRVAMRVLFLTTGPGVRGVISDDGFMIGRFSPVDTANLLAFGTVVGVLGAFVYLAVRVFLVGPPWLRQLTCTLAAAAVIGSMLVHTDGVDFRLLEPTWLAIGLFVGLPALFAFLAVPLIEQAIRPDGWFATAPRRKALLPLLAFVFPLLLVPVALPAVGVLAARRGLERRPRAMAALRHPVSMWTVRAGFLAVAVGGLVSLVRDSLVLL